MPKRSSRYNKGGPLKGEGITNYRLDAQAMTFTPQEARAEYARLRREANRRLEVLGRSDFAKLPGVQRAAGGFAALPRTASEKQIRKQLYAVARYLNQRTSSLQGAKRAQRAFIESMREHGYTFVNKRNAAALGRFLGAVQKHKEAKGYDSDQLVTLFETAHGKFIDTSTLEDDFKFWLQHMDELKSAPAAKTITSSEKFAKRIGLEIE